MACQVKSFSPRIVILYMQTSETIADAATPRDDAMLFFAAAIFFDAQKSFFFISGFFFCVYCNISLKNSVLIYSRRLRPVCSAEDVQQGPEDHAGHRRLERGLQAVQPPGRGPRQATYFRQVSGHRPSLETHPHPQPRASGGLKQFQLFDLVPQHFTVKNTRFLDLF